MKQDYFLGLDIGTDSVGWAVTDTSYKVLKCNGKALWGVRLFDPAQPAEERRMARVARRRLERRNQRLKWLEQVFSEEIAKVDPAFFQRLRESKFREEDKKSDYPLGRYTLFADKAYGDKDFHRDYPTIYHLRRALIAEAHPFDARLVYLAVHHILKNRGHFLFGDMSIDAITFEASFEKLRQHLLEAYELKLEVSDLDSFSSVLTNRKLSITAKSAKLIELAGLPKEKGPVQAMMQLLAGRKVALDALFDEELPTDDVPSFSLRDDFETVEGKLIEVLGDRIDLIHLLKEIYDWALLAELLNGYRYLSFAKVQSFEKHRVDLKRLKGILKAVDGKAYAEMFRHAKKDLDNYLAYCGHGAKGYHCDADAFYKYLAKQLKAISPQTEEIRNVLQEVECRDFLPLQTTKDNSVIPHQLHEAELKLILKNAAQYLPFLNETDETGLTKKEQILQVFRFRIPYYVGPLNEKSNRSWIVRSPEKIYPWNFEQVVDIGKCAERFIAMMTAKCTYLGEDILPKNSLLYTRFSVLNELNNLRINGKKISVKQKQRIYIDLFLHGYKVSQKRLKDYLLANGIMEKADVISGIDGDFKSNLAPWHAYAWLLNRENGVDIAEDIIRHITLFGEDRKLLERWLRDYYSAALSDEERRQALRQKYSGWGKLSREFLTIIFHVDPNTGEALSIIDALWNTNDNLMELLSGRYTFLEAVKEYCEDNTDMKSGTLQDYLDEHYAAPGIKRAIHQTVAIVGEIEKIMKCSPTRVFVEMAREDGEKGKRTVTRKAELSGLYAKCGEEAGELLEQLEARTEGELRRDKLYLYYTQLGRCMYCGEPIDLNRLDVDYDIDHIYPQSKTKDDSLQNRVLVKRELNARKSDEYPLSPQTRTARRPFWEMLRTKGLISQTKFERLVRASGFTENEMEGFIARQLVETRQSTKIVAELLQNRYGDTSDVVYVKAGNVSVFRQDQRIGANGKQKQAGVCGHNEVTIQDPLFVKCREVNDFHHAKDAYLNIVVGNVYHVVFTKNPLAYLKARDFKYSLNHIYDYDVVRDGERAWTAGADGTIATVRHVMGKNNILYTRMAKETKGPLFDLQIVGKTKGQAAVKSSDPRMTVDKFGGYNKPTGTYFCLVEHTVGKKQVRSLEPVLLMHKALYEKNPMDYCTQRLNLKDPRILISCVKIDSLISFDGFRMHISSRSGNQVRYKNANQLVIASEWQTYFKKISKYLDRCKKAKTDLPVTLFDGITSEENIRLYELLLEKLRTSRYHVKYETAATTVAENRGKFNGLAVPEQCRILMQVLNLFACNVDGADFKALGGKEGVGIVQTSKNLSSYSGHSIKLIHQSVTGVFEQEVDLLAEDLP